MAKKPRKTYFWETNDFLIVLTDETAHGQQVLDSTRAIIKDVENDEAVIVTSAIVLSEILPKVCESRKLGSYAKFQAFLRRVNVDPRDVDIAVADKVAEIREALIASKGKGPICEKCGHSTDKRRWADMVYVATAALYKDELDYVHSVDPHFKRLVELAGIDLEVTAPSHPSVSSLAGTLFSDGLMGLEAEISAPVAPPNRVYDFED